MMSVEMEMHPRSQEHLMANTSATLEIFAEKQFYYSSVDDFANRSQFDRLTNMLGHFRAGDNGPDGPNPAESLGIIDGVELPARVYRPGTAHNYSPQDHVQGLTALIAHAANFSLEDKAAMLQIVVDKASVPLRDPGASDWARPLHRKVLSENRTHKAALKQLEAMASKESGLGSYGSFVVSADSESSRLLEEMNNRWAHSPDRVAVVSAGVAGTIAAVALGRRLRR